MANKQIEIETSITNQLRSTPLENYRNNQKARTLNSLKAADQRTKIAFEEEVYNYDISWASILQYSLAFLGAVGMVYALIRLSVLFN